jgi:hypothetical protein
MKDHPSPAGSLSHPTANKIIITKRGEKFPPLKYDADEPPAISIDSDSRRGADMMQDRKQRKVTKVIIRLPKIECMLMDVAFSKKKAT